MQRCLKLRLYYLQQMIGIGKKEHTARKVYKSDIRKENSIHHSEYRDPSITSCRVPHATLKAYFKTHCHNSHKQGVFNCRYYNFYAKKQHWNTKNWYFLYEDILMIRGKRMSYDHRIVGGLTHETNETRNKTNEGETKYSMATTTVNSRLNVVWQIYSRMSVIILGISSLFLKSEADKLPISVLRMGAVVEHTDLLEIIELGLLEEILVLE